jgi:hypothetical protein
VQLIEQSPDLLVHRVLVGLRRLLSHLYRTGPSTVP